jgi:hypothetical protein
MDASGQISGTVAGSTRGTGIFGRSTDRFFGM